MSYIDNLVKLTGQFLETAQQSLDKIASIHQPKYSVWWRNPDKENQWEIYQSNLSKNKAEKLSKDIKYGFGARWFDHNPQTQILPDGQTI